MNCELVTLGVIRRQVKTWLEALVENTGIEGFELDFAGWEVFESVKEFLPKLSHLSSLIVKSVGGGVQGLDALGMPDEMKTQLYQSALLNTGLTQLSLEPFCEEDTQFKQDLTSVCIRNKVGKIIGGIRDSPPSLSLIDLPDAIVGVQSDCKENEESPDSHVTGMIFAGLRSNTQAVEGFKKYFDGQNDPNDSDPNDSDSNETDSNETNRKRHHSDTVDATEAAKSPRGI